MRVLAVGATGVLSGAERVLLRLASAAPGDDWTVVSPAGPLGVATANLGLSHVQIPDLKLGEGSRPLATASLAGRNLRAVPTLRKLCADGERSFDVIVVNSLMALPAVVASRPKRPVVWFVHDVVTRGDLLRVVGAVRTRVHAAIAVSEAAAALPRRLGIHTVVVPNGVPFPASPAKPTEPPVIGVNALLTPWKGQDVFLDALALVDRPWRAQLLGGTLPKDAAFEAELRRRASRPDLTGRIEFMGHLDRPVDAMRAWTISVSASREPEAGPLNVMEAMGLGLAVIVTDHGGGPEVLGGCGQTVAPEDPIALAEAIDRYLADPGLRRTDGAAARVRAGECFELGESCAEFRAALVELADRGAARSEVAS